MVMSFSRIRLIVARGFRRRCPRCGEGALFRDWMRPHEECSSCRLRFQQNGGDTWMFIVITDRVPILIGIAAMYFGVRPTTLPGIVALILALAVPIAATIRERIGMAIALDYLARIYLPDPADEIHRSEYVVVRR